MKQKLIMFVGHDGVGKTNIIEELTKRTRIPNYKYSREKDRYVDFLSVMMYSADAIMQYAEKTGQSVIYDRGFPCEYAYSKLYNRHTSISKIDELCSRFVKLGGIVIHCFKTADKFEDDPEDPVEKEQYPDIKKYYDEFFSEHLELPVYNFDTSSCDLEKQMEELKTVLNNFFEEEVLQ